MTYRSEIDGLRAIAVLSVILFHAGIPYFHGGFIGVDVFFVISGYLITQLIVKDLELGIFSFQKFYERRARRILPALITVLLCTFVFSWVWMMPIEMKAFSKSMLSALLFSSNMYFWSTSDYFDTDAELKPLLHTWSLSVEEQFYILFPMFLAFVFKFGRSKLKLSILILTLISFTFSFYISDEHKTFNFYWIFSRAWELLAGAFCVLITTKRNVIRDNIASGLGTCAIIASALVIDKTETHPLYIFVPVAGTLAILLFANSDTVTQKILSWKPFVAIGLISYSAYLWHQPIFALIRLNMLEPGFEIMFVAIMLTFILATISWRYIEQPFRHSTNFVFSNTASAKKILIASATLIVALASIGILYRGPLFRLSDEQLDLVLSASRSPKRALCHTPQDVKLSPPEESCIYFGSKPTVAVYGNSHGVELAYGLARELDKQNQALIHFTISGCDPSFLRKTLHYCEEFFENRLNYILSNPNIRHVVLAYRVEKSGPEASRSLVNLANHFSRNGKNTVLVLQAPVLQRDIFIYLRNLFRTGQTIAPALSRQQWGEDNRDLYNALAKLDKVVRVLDLADLFCDRDECFAVKDGIAMYYDTHHMSVAAAQIAGKQIIERLREPVIKD